MRIINLKIFIFFVFCAFSLRIDAQDSRYVSKNDSIINLIDSLKEISPSIEVSSDYANKVVFWGRDFGRNQFGFENSIIFKTGNGFYFNYTGYLWSVMPNPYAKYDIGVGYEHQFTDRLYASLGYERWFFNNGGDYVRKALRNYLEADINYDLDWVNIEPTFYYMFGIVNVYQADLNINSAIPLFQMKKNGTICIKPQFLTTMANQAFLPIYSEYPNGYVNENKFKIIDFEFNIPITLKINNFEFEPNFHYNIPIKINNEQITSFFYFSARIAFNMYFDKGKIKKLSKTLR
ncbi:MAG: hypothetical protein ACXVPM_19870 [Bacteroidia bacterium]